MEEEKHPNIITVTIDAEEHWAKMLEAKKYLLTGKLSAPEIENNLPDLFVHHSFDSHIPESKDTFTVTVTLDLTKEKQHENKLKRCFKKILGIKK